MSWSKNFINSSSTPEFIQLVGIPGNISGQGVSQDQGIME
jgi:hypothetical protein